MRTQLLMTLQVHCRVSLQSEFGLHVRLRIVDVRGPSTIELGRLFVRQRVRCADATQPEIANSRT
jgi:hypothetical protein